MHEHDSELETSLELFTYASSTTDPYGRGVEIGARYAERVRQNAARYHDFLRRLGVPEARIHAIGERSFDALTSWSSELAAEIEGTAAGCDLSLQALANLNARTEILTYCRAGAKAECSTAVYVGAASAQTLSLQTWDWHDSLSPCGLIRHFRTNKGMSVKLFTEFGMLAKIGVNSAGLGLHFNILRHASDTCEGGVPVHAIARRILDEAHSVDEAIELARSATVCASTVFTAFAGTGAERRAASIEVCPQGVGVVSPNLDGWLFHTNHFLDPDLATGEQTLDPETTFTRLEHLRAQAVDMRCEELVARARGMCGSLGAMAPLCFYPDLTMPDTERWETLLTVSIDTAQFALEYYPGTPIALAEHGAKRF